MYIVDTTFWEALNPSGLTTFANRGYVRGTASGIPSAFSDKITVGWANSAAQYWVKASSAGAFTSPKMKPGTYTQTREFEFYMRFVGRMWMCGG